MSVRDVAIQYFACVSAHDAEGLSNLFAEDALLRPPRPVSVEKHGRAEIRAFYSDLFTRHPTLAVEPDYQLVVDGKVCAALFTASRDGKRLGGGVVDVFTVNERDELVEMTAYSRLPEV